MFLLIIFCISIVSLFTSLVNTTKTVGDRTLPKGKPTGNEKIRTCDLHPYNSCCWPHDRTNCNRGKDRMNGCTVISNSFSFCFYCIVAFGESDVPVWYLGWNSTMSWQMPLGWLEKIRNTSDHGSSFSIPNHLFCLQRKLNILKWIIWLLEEVLNGVQHAHHLCVQSSLLKWPFVAHMTYSAGINRGWICFGVLETHRFLILPSMSKETTVEPNTISTALCYFSPTDCQRTFGVYS